ncbi:hypothetical protein F5H01DRAFT_292101, partial [Linnemannia elongata]
MKSKLFFFLSPFLPPFSTPFLPSSYSFHVGGKLLQGKKRLHAFFFFFFLCLLVCVTCASQVTFSCVHCTYPIRHVFFRSKRQRKQS